ncbi:MAG: zf-TFIIB domain-containing protein [Deltaproteobacteria bacterium]|nr:zf-TFIIB domain-containing protein [Deltaproteobacteria bacterium]
MKCPVCTSVNLVMTDRQGVEIDYCPQCRGVWLDRGELDKIIERTAVVQPVVQQHVVHGGHGHDHDDHYKYHKKHKPKSLLGELFDF